MSNPLVQNAVRYALDYDGINALVGGPAVTTAVDSAARVFSARTARTTPFKRDLDMATSLLAQAGYPNGFSVDLQYPTNFARQRRELRHRRAEDPVGPGRRGDHRHAQAGRDQHRAAELSRRQRRASASGCGVQTTSTPTTTWRFCPKASSANAPTGPTPTPTRRSSSCAIRSTSRRTPPSARAAVAAGPGLPAAERPVGDGHPARRVHRHAGQYRQLHLQPASGASTRTS